MRKRGAHDRCRDSRPPRPPRRARGAPGSPHAIIVVGAQAIYLRAGEIPGVAVAVYTTDGDLVIDPAILGTDPRIEQALTSGGFKPLMKAQERVIGSWVTDFDVAVDVMVPAKVAGAGTMHSRGVDAPPHDRYAMRRTRGLEGALVEHSVMTIAAIDPTADGRSFDVKVAGPAALLVAKLYKISERIGQTTRLDDKDAHDIYRLLRAIETTPLSEEFQRLMTAVVSKDVTTESVGMLRDLFGTNGAPGSVMAGRAEDTVGDPAQVSLAVSILTGDLLAALGT